RGLARVIAYKQARDGKDPQDSWLLKGMNFLAMACDAVSLFMMSSSDFFGGTGDSLTNSAENLNSGIDSMLQKANNIFTRILAAVGRTISKVMGAGGKLFKAMGAWFKNGSGFFRKLANRFAETMFRSLQRDFYNASQRSGGFDMFFEKWFDMNFQTLALQVGMSFLINDVLFKFDAEAIEAGIDDVDGALQDSIEVLESAEGLDDAARDILNAARGVNATLSDKLAAIMAAQGISGDVIRSVWEQARNVFFSSLISGVISEITQKIMRRALGYDGDRRGLQIGQEEVVVEQFYDEETGELIFERTEVQWANDYARNLAKFVDIAVGIGSSFILDSALPGGSIDPTQPAILQRGMDRVTSFAYIMNRVIAPIAMFLYDYVGDHVKVGQQTSWQWSDQRTDEEKEANKPLRFMLVTTEVLQNSFGADLIGGMSSGIVEYVNTREQARMNHLAGQMQKVALVYESVNDLGSTEEKGVLDVNMETLAASFFDADWDIFGNTLDFLVYYTTDLAKREGFNDISITAKQNLAIAVNEHLSMGGTLNEFDTSSQAAQGFINEYVAIAEELFKGGKAVDLGLRQIANDALGANASFMHVFLSFEISIFAHKNNLTAALGVGFEFISLMPQLESKGIIEWDPATGSYSFASTNENDIQAAFTDGKTSENLSAQEQRDLAVIFAVLNDTDVVVDGKLQPRNMQEMSTEAQTFSQEIQSLFNNYNRDIFDQSLSESFMNHVFVVDETGQLVTFADIVDRQGVQNYSHEVTGMETVSGKVKDDILMLGQVRADLYRGVQISDTESEEFQQALLEIGKADAAILNGTNISGELKLAMSEGTEYGQFLTTLFAENIRFFGVDSESGQLTSLRLDEAFDNALNGNGGIEYGLLTSISYDQFSDVFNQVLNYSVTVKDQFNIGTGVTNFEDNFTQGIQGFAAALKKDGFIVEKGGSKILAEKAQENFIAMAKSEIDFGSFLSSARGATLRIMLVSDKADMAVIHTLVGGSFVSDNPITFAEFIGGMESELYQFCMTADPGVAAALIDSLATFTSYQFSLAGLDMNSPTLINDMATIFGGSIGQHIVGRAEQTFQSNGKPLDTRVQQSDFVTQNIAVAIFKGLLVRDVAGKTFTTGMTISKQDQEQEFVTIASLIGNAELTGINSETIFHMLNSVLYVDAFSDQLATHEGEQLFDFVSVHVINAVDAYSAAYAQALDEAGGEGYGGNVSTEYVASLFNKAFTANFINTLGTFAENEDGSYTFTNRSVSFAALVNKTSSVSLVVGAFNMTSMMANAYISSVLTTEIPTPV
ncbi:hypothetical protein ACFL3D_06560, partial [Candidatus Omnitrophota bacterium]